MNCSIRDSLRPNGNLYKFQLIGNRLKKFNRKASALIVCGYYRLNPIIQKVTALNSSLPKRSGEELNEKVLDKAFNNFVNLFDSENGGFGVAPKFPSPHNLLFLLRYWKRKDEPRALEMVEKTLNEKNILR